MTDTYETLKIEMHDPKIMVVIMNRPQALNAMNTKMMTEMRDCFQSFYVNPDQANCVILTGEGDRGFCSGADLKERDGMTEETWKQQHAIVEQMVRALQDLPPAGQPGARKLVEHLDWSTTTALIEHHLAGLASG